MSKLNIDMELEIEHYVFCITVTYFHVEKPNHSADNPDDFYGYVDLEYDCDCVVEFDEDGEESIHIGSVADHLVGEYDSLLRDMIIEKLTKGED